MFYSVLPLEGRLYHDNDHVAVAVEHKMFAFEGHQHHLDEVDQIHVNVFNTLSLCWTELPPVMPGRRGERNPEVACSRRGHTAVLMGDIVYVWGGRCYCNYKYCNVLYGFDVDTHRWVKPEVFGTVPEGREYHAACVLGKVMYIYGGSTQRPLVFTNDMYMLDTITMVWALINIKGTSPQASTCHHCTIIGTKMFVFGDCYYNKHNGMRVFDTETNHWLSTPSAQPLPRRSYCRSDFAYNGELYIVCGRDFPYEGFDLWKFSPATFSWKKRGKGVQGIGQRLCCCIVGDRVILFDHDMCILDLSPSLKTLCKLAVIQYLLDQSELPHNIRWELAAMSYKPPKTN